MRFYVHYFGCRSNQAEVQEWLIALERLGYQVTRNLQEADFAILNTCSVTDSAEREALRFIDRVFKNTRAPWIITGCTVNRQTQDLPEKYKQFFFVGNQDKKGLVELVRRQFPLESNLLFNSSYKSRIFLKIQDGCSCRCSFCIVPKLRGRPSSLSREQLREKAVFYAGLGYREIVLTGINLSAYGYDLFPRLNLLDALVELEDIPGIEIMRLSSLDPRYLKYQFIKNLAGFSKLAETFHFSFQSGSDAVLRRMNRAGRSAEHRKYLQQFRRLFPQANLGADIIVGFPGETDREFQETLDFVSSSGLNYLHVFPFSPRPGTRAASMPALNPKTVKYRRELLSGVARRLREEYRALFLQRELAGIVLEEDQGHGLVVTRNNLCVRIQSRPGLRKKAVTVLIKSIVSDNLMEGVCVS